MSTNFPGAIDSFVNPTASSDEVLVPHASQHANANDAITAIETKVGTNGSAVTTTHTYKLSGVTGSDKAASLTGAEVLSGKTLTTPTTNGGTSTSETIVTPTINVGSDVPGDVLVRNSGGALTRVAPGAVGTTLTSNGTGVLPSFQTPTTVTSTQVQNQTFTFVNDSGSSTAYVGTYTPVVASYTAGLGLYFKANNTNTTTTPTFNANAVGAKTVINPDGTAIFVGQIVAGGIYHVVYEATADKFILQTQNTSVSKAVYTDVPSSAVTTTSSVTAYTTTIPANTFNVGSIIKGSLMGQIANGSGSVGSITIVYGGTTLASYTNGSASTVQDVFLDYEVHIISATTANIFIQNRATGNGAVSAATAIASITSSQTLTISLSVTNGTTRYYSSELQKIR